MAYERLSADGSGTPRLRSCPSFPSRLSFTLSMWQTDVIHYGADLLDYIHQEFDQARGDVDEGWNPRATAPFWRDFL
jgi:hypothetical protein